MKTTDLGNKKLLLEFDDILDFTAYAEGGPEDGKSRGDSEYRIRFSGGKWQDAVTQARSGNPELVKSFFDGVNVLSAMIEEEKIGEIRDVTGEYFDVADYLSGEPECFRREEFGDHRQVIPVYANFGMNYTINKNIIRNRGCGIIALCDELSKSGFIVDLHLVQAVSPGVFDTFENEYYTNIKVSLDPLDLDTAAFIIANPLCLRRLWFAELERATGESNCHGYGVSIEYDLSTIFESGVSGFYFVSSNHDEFDTDNYRSMESTKTHILEMIENFKESAEQVILG